MPFTEFKKIYTKVPRFCIDLVIKDTNGGVLSKRDIPPSKGKWHLPGGTMLFGEKISDTIDRVAQEETGLKVRMKKLLGVIEFSHQSAFGHSISAVYLANPSGGNLRGSKQGRGIRFFNKIPPNIIREHKEFLIKNKLLPVPNNPKRRLSDN